MRTPAAGASPRALPAAAPRALALRTEASALTGRRRLPPVPRTREGTGFIPDSTDVLFPDPIDMSDNGVFCGCLCGSPVHLSKKWERGRLQAAFCTLKEARPPGREGDAMPAGEGRGGSQPEDRCSGPAPPGCPRPRGCGRETWGDGAAGTTFDLPLLRPFPRPKALCVCPRPASKPGLVNTDAGDRKGPARGFTRRKPHKDPTSQTAGLCPRGFTEPLAREALVHQVKGTRGHSQALNATQSTGPNADFSIQTKSTKIKGFRHLEPRRADGAPGGPTGAQSVLAAG